MPQSKVLLVEDLNSYAMLVGAYVRNSGEFVVSHVDTLAATRGRLRDCDDFDVVILDLNLPDSTGLATFESLHRGFPDMPIVILSGQDDEELAVEAVRRGAQDYLPKADVGAPLLVRSLRYAIERSQRQTAERRHLLIERDLDVARQIQRHLLPAEPPNIDAFDIAAVCQPADACGGDFFDFIPMHDGSWDLLIANVSSHGFGPALIMVGARRVLRTCAPMHKDIGEILTVANRAVMEDTLAGQFVTLSYARLEPATRTLTFSSAGHPFWIATANGAVTTPKYPGLPLGVIPDSTYVVDGSFTLQTGDMVLMMTDGAWEAADRDGQPFGQQRIFDLIHQHRERTAAEILDMLLEEITRFRDQRDASDDVTFVLVKFDE